jgi:hypothetical protein
LPLAGATPRSRSGSRTRTRLLAHAQARLPPHACRHGPSSRSARAGTSSWHGHTPCADAESLPIPSKKAQPRSCRSQNFDVSRRRNIRLTSQCERHITPFPKRRSPSARDVRTVSEIPACAGSRGMKGTASCSCPHRWDATPEDDLRRLLSRHVCAKTGDERGHFHSKRCRHRCC